MQNYGKLQNNILKIQGVNVKYGDTSILRDVSLVVKPKEIIGIVGESGSGKTTLINTIMGLLGKDGYVESGDIFYDGKNLFNMNKEDLRKLKGEEIALISQDPVSTFHPTRKIKTQLFEMAKMHNLQVSVAKEEMLRLMKIFRLVDGERILNSYSFELSGGMCQRVSIAMAMVLKPKILIADEPTSALDVITQKEVIKELIKVKEELNTSIIIVSHNMGVISHMADRVVVMYAGSIVESGSTQEIIKNAMHPYTKNLFAAVPKIGEKMPNNIVATKVDRSLSGCIYHNVCSCQKEECKHVIPHDVKIKDGCCVKCHLYDKELA